MLFVMLVFVLVIGDELFVLVFCVGKVLCLGYNYVLCVGDLCVDWLVVGLVLCFCFDVLVVDLLVLCVWLGEVFVSIVDDVVWVGIFINLLKVLEVEVYFEVVVCIL